MPAFHVQKSILIEAPTETVKNTLQDFRQWPAWSPWLLTEPDAKVDFSVEQSVVGSSYSWEGDLVGKGSMAITAISESKIRMQLTFITPFKSEAQVYFDLLPEGQDTTRVVWNMDSKLPFFMFFMVKMMKSWIGMDYERGLAMLKEYIETEEVISRVENATISTIPATAYIGINGECSLDDIEKVMPDHFQQLCNFKKTNDLTTEGATFAIYHTMNMHTQMISFTSAIPIPKDTQASAPLFYGELPETRVLQVNHIGRYSHLGNAWSSVMAFARYKKIKLKKKPKGYEFYVNDPDEVAVEDLQTQVCLPLK